MRSSLKNNPVRTVRGICHLTQAELAQVIGCARLTVLALESGKLKLSEMMAEKISLQTGVSKSWLLSNDHSSAAVCEKDPQRPFTVEVFKTTRAEVSDPRSDPFDVVAIQNVLASAFARLNDAAILAYRSNEIIYFHYMLREFLRELAARWPESHELAPTMVVAEIYTQSSARFENARQQKSDLNRSTEAKRAKSVKLGLN